jgi:hypothetical protein
MVSRKNRLTKTFLKFRLNPGFSKKTSRPEKGRFPDIPLYIKRAKPGNFGSKLDKSPAFFP